MLLRRITLVLPLLLLGEVDAWSQSSALRHGLFTALLQEYVLEGRVDYEEFARDERFSAYLDFLAGTDPHTLPTARDQLAFWINAYNAYTIRLILDHLPLSSIRDISLGLPILFGPWSIDIAVVGGTSYTLNHIEHDIIRERFNEPRIHFALVCAALSCPNLRQEAYEGSTLEQQLEEETRRFLVDSTKNRFDVRGKVLYLSRIFDWYEGDFEEAAGSMPAFLLSYVDEELGAFLSGGDYRIEFLDYDWSLNAAKTGGKAGATP